MKRISLRKMVELSILLSICIAISLLDGLISSFIFPSLPGIKIGLANIMILVILYQYGFKEGLIVCLLKSIIAGLLFSGITSFIIGGIASLLSYLVMALIKLWLEKHVSMVSVSFCGGITHILTQLAVVSIIYKLGSVVFSYGIYLVLLSIVTSIVIGFVAIECNKLISKIRKANNEY